MGEDYRKHPVIFIPGPRASRIIVILFLLVLLLIVVPAAGVTSTAGAGLVKDPAGMPATLSFRARGADPSLVSAASDRALTVRPSPTPTPARLNRTSLLQTLVKNAAERPKVTIPAFLYILIVVIAFAGLGVLLYLLIRRGAGSSAGDRIRAGNHATIVEVPTAAEASPGYPEPAVPFPPSLRKRFLNPVFIGEGGLARVFRVQNARTHQTVAVKIPVRFDEITGTHFTRDIVFWQGLEHENIIRIYSSNILPVPYVEMEYAPSSLSALPLPLPEEKAVGLISGIARGVAYAHGKGIVHRDIKPENILLASDGTPKITDWGLGKAIGDSRQSSMIGFSPAYAAPEQIAPQRYGRPGPATDIYQLGMLLYEMLTGAVPFEGEGLHDLNLAILDNPLPLPSWHGTHVGELRAILKKCLEKRPEDRYDSVADLIRDLESIRFPA